MNLLAEPLLGDAIVAVVALDRLVELLRSLANVRRLVARGAIVVPRDGTAGMIAFHSLWLVALACERLFLSARMPEQGVALTLAATVLLIVAARVWVLATLGRRWTVRVVVVPGETPISRGPYRFLRHPNYVVVCAELLLVPLLVGAWRVAIVGSLAHLPVLRHRVRREEAAWREIARAGLGTGPRAAPADGAAERS